MKLRRRIIFKLIVFLLAGAIINVAVAWAVARPTAFGDWNSGKATSFPGFMDKYFSDIRSTTYEQMRGDVMVWLTGAEYAGLTYGPTMQQQITRVKCGFPMFALAGQASRDLSSVTQSSRGAIVCAGERILALVPIWPGFAINTIFYTAVLWMLFALPGAVRRRVRIKRGQCAAGGCGYSLREITSDKCPECGAAIPR